MPFPKPPSPQPTAICCACEGMGRRFLSLKRQIVPEVINTKQWCLIAPRGPHSLPTPLSLAEQSSATPLHPHPIPTLRPLPPSPLPRLNCTPQQPAVPSPSTDPFLSPSRCVLLLSALWWGSPPVVMLSSIILLCQGFRFFRH